VAYDRDRLSLGPEITTAWLRGNTAVAASIPRGNSTPDSRLFAALQEYEYISRISIQMGEPDRGGEALSSELGEFAPAPRPDRGSDDRGGRLEVSRWGRRTRDTYGAGRAYERAIQEARWGRAYSNVECVEQSDAWLEANP